MHNFCFLLFFLSAGAMAAPLHFNQGPAPVIDGLEEASWAAVPSLAMKSCPSGRPVNMETSVKIMYDSRNLYFFVRCREVNLVEARQQEHFSVHDAAVWNNDCVEILVDSKNNSRSYYQFVVDVHNDSADFLLYDPEWNRAPLEWNGIWQHAVGTYGDGWTMEAAIPWSTFGFGIFDARKVRLNVSRVRRISPFERLALTSDGHNFHDLGSFIGYEGLKLEKPPLKAEITSPGLFLGDNRIALNLNNPGNKAVDGTLELALREKSGKESETSSKITLAPGAAATPSLPCRVSVPGDYCLMLKLDGEILGTRYYTVRQQMEINDPLPVITSGEPCNFLLQIHTTVPTEAVASVIDSSGKERLREKLPAQRKSFCSLPTGKLPAGEYLLRITSGGQQRDWPLLIVPAL